jgi:hypothetical protein
VAYTAVMVKHYPYPIYVVGVFVAWAITFLIAWSQLSPSKFQGVLIFGSGFMLGVLAASLARKVFK